MGLSYSSRTSVSYLYGGEFLRSDRKIDRGNRTFIIAGVLYCLTSLWFWQLKD